MLGMLRILEAEHVARELDDDVVAPAARPECRHSTFATEAQGAQGVELSGGMSQRGVRRHMRCERGVELADDSDNNVLAHLCPLGRWLSHNMPSEARTVQ
jgi:hypothetical protein